MPPQAIHLFAIAVVRTNRHYEGQGAQLGKH